MTGLYCTVFYFGSIWARGWPIRISYFAMGVVVMLSLVSVRTSIAVGFDYYIRTISGEPVTPAPLGGDEDAGEAPLGNWTRDEHGVSLYIKPGEGDL